MQKPRVSLVVVLLVLSLLCIAVVTWIAVRDMRGSLAVPGATVTA